MEVSKKTMRKLVKMEQYHHLDQILIQIRRFNVNIAMKPIMKKTLSGIM
ncbi:MAG: hypothetical protein OIN87_07775 [Candidatus Methanoperedens sp.]|nr:hypothetical protein [Candidatus Methanoperedens sp.]